ncbi:MAG: hypothetical protein IT445_13750 [Phycisphaeraceae bacterium]|nr:hypothetical protein [Phycisphaeraceae bacterium]
MRLVRSFVWACYLGSSWTWVIGMLLPVLLLRDYGPAGWLVFAIPNVLGAAAFGFVLNRQRSAVLSVRHAVACLGFSRVTVAFQIIVLPWALVELLCWPLPLAVGCMLAAYALFMLLVRARSWLGAAALAVSFISLAAFAWFAFHADAWVDVWRSPMLEPRLGRMGLYAFIPAAAFGFLLCPYLDLTFHYACQNAPHPRLAFVLGFVVIFAAMIVFSLAYAGLGAIALRDGISPLDHGLVRWVIGGHVIMQSAFTAALHLERVQQIEQVPLGRIVLPLPLFLLIGLLLLMHYPQKLEGFDMNVSQMVYRVLLMLYGTFFPAYVLMMMIPTRRPVQYKPRLRTYLFAVGMSLPMAFIAFVEGHALYVIGVLAVLAIARLVVETLPEEVDADDGNCPFTRS